MTKDRPIPIADTLEEIAKFYNDAYNTNDDDREEAIAAALIRQLTEALVRADQFIENGIEFGSISMPDPETLDPALETPGIIKDAIKAAWGEDT